MAKGTIIKRDLVHGYSYYGSDETTECGEAATEEVVAFSIEEILSPHEIKQPLYNYELNAGGGVTSWEAASCLCKCFLGVNKRKFICVVFKLLQRQLKNLNKRSISFYSVVDFRPGQVIWYIRVK